MLRWEGAAPPRAATRARPAEARRAGEAAGRAVEARVVAGTAGVEEARGPAGEGKRGNQSWSGCCGAW